MNGAAVDMVITRESNNIYATATVTPTNGENEFTMYFSYLFGNATSANIGLFLTVQNAQIVLNTAEQTKSYLKVLSNDFEDAETYTNGWTVSGNSQLTLNGSKYMHLYNNVSASRSFESAVSGAKDYVMEFDWNIGQNNGNGGGGTVLSVTGLDNSSTVTLFTAEKTSTGWASAFNLKNGSGTDLGTGELTGDGYKKDAALTFWYHFRLAGNETEGTTLTVTKNSAGSLNTYTSVLAEYKLSDDCIAPNGITVMAVKNAACAGIDNLFVYSYSTSETVTDPTIELPVYAGANRTVSITSGISSKGNTVHTYYTLDGTDPTALSTEYSTALTIEENCTLKAITISSTGKSSSVVSQAVTVGKLTLNAPTFVKTEYSAGTYTVTISSSQSSLAYVPADPVIKYSIDGGSEMTYSSAIAVPGGSTVTAHVEADNYSNSSTSDLTVFARPAFIEDWTLDFAGQATADKGGVAIDTGNESFKVGTTSFYPITSDGFTSNSNFAVASNNNLLLRNTGSKGLYSQASGNRDIAIGDLKEGQYVIINCVSLDNYNSVEGVGEFMSDYSTSNQIIFRATANGNMSINLARYIYIQSISVCRVITGIKPGLGTNGYATFACDYALDLRKANLPAGITAAYKAAVDGNTVRFTELDQTVPAYTGVLLEGNPDAATLDLMIPVVPSGDVVTDNAFEVNTAGTYFTPEAGYTYYGLLKNTLTFRPFDPLTVVIPAYKAYLKVESASPVHGLDVTFEGADGIETLKNVDSENMGNSMFDLSGRRVAKAQKGIYIVNGKKVVK